MTSAPVRSITSANVRCRAAMVGSQVTISPPYVSTARDLARLAPRGITTVARMPRQPAARLSARPWFPDEWVATPRDAWASSRL
jgi:hypothetical protein